MKQLFLVLFLLLALSARSQDDADFKKGIDFVGLGTEPFWSVKIDDEKSVSFDMMSNEIKFKTGKPEITNPDDKSITYTASNKKYFIRIDIKKDSCGDGMSDKIYPYSVKIKITTIKTDKIKELSGCGYFTCNTRINDIWALDKFNGEKLNKELFSKTKPYIEINIAQNRIGGNSGCNEFWSYMELRGDKIFIKNNFTMTKMFCDDNGFEMNFIGALSGKTLVYKIKGLKLTFIENGKIVMEFHKID